MDSILKYIGKKRIGYEVDKMDKYAVYIEPFSGSFNSGFNLIERGYRGKVVLNDKDASIINFWERVRDNWRDVYNNIYTLTQEALDLENEIEAKEIIPAIRDKYRGDSIKEASIEYIYRFNNSMNGVNYIRSNLPQLLELDMAVTSEMLHHITITNRDALEICEEYKDREDVYMMIDPPYKVTNSSTYYRLDGELFNHVKLGKVLEEVKFSWLVTYNDALEVEEIYKNFKKEREVRDLGGMHISELYIRNHEEKIYKNYMYMSNYGWE